MITLGQAASPTHTQCLIKHTDDADKASQASGRSIFQKACAQGTPKWDSGLTYLS